MGSDIPEPKKSQDYKNYLQAYGVQNSKGGEKIKYTNEEQFANLVKLGVLPEGFKPKTHTKNGKEFLSTNFVTLNDSNAPRGEFTDTELMDETAYYEYAYNKKKKEYEEEQEEKEKEQENEFKKALEDQQTAITKAREEQEAKLKLKQEQIELEQNTKMRNDLLADRMTAEEASINYVNSQIDKERSNAALFGVQYKITDEQKSSRISRYFTDIWGDKEETQLAGLFDKVGKPEDFKDFSVTRLSADDTIGLPPEKKEASQTVVSSTKGTMPKSNTTLLGGGATLGGKNTLLGG